MWPKIKKWGLVALIVLLEFALYDVIALQLLFLIDIIPTALLGVVALAIAVSVLFLTRTSPLKRAAQIQLALIVIWTVLSVIRYDEPVTGRETIVRAGPHCESLVLKVAFINVNLFPAIQQYLIHVQNDVCRFKRLGMAVKHNPSSVCPRKTPVEMMECLNQIFDDTVKQNQVTFVGMLVYPAVLAAASSFAGDYVKAQEGAAETKKDRYFEIMVNVFEGLARTTSALLHTRSLASMTEGTMRLVARGIEGAMVNVFADGLDKTEKMFAGMEEHSIYQSSNRTAEQQTLVERYEIAKNQILSTKFPRTNLEELAKEIQHAVGITR